MGAAARDYAVHLDEWLLAGRASRFIVDVPAAAPPPVRDFAGPYLFAIGRLVADKGFAVAIRALSAMRHRDVHLVIAARPAPFGDTLRELAETPGVADRVDLIGWVADAAKNAWIQHAAVGLVPSAYESFGIVAIALMAAGVPVVVSDVGGLAEIVTDGVDGLRVPPGEPEPLAAAVDKLLDAPQSAADMGKAGRTSVLRRFNWDDIARQTVAVYQGVAE